jgi:apolipoprotein N-acyltransferase
MRQVLSSPFITRPAVRLAGCVLSGVLLVLAYPLPNLNFLVWIACVPLILAAVFEPRPILGFVWGCVTGVIFLAGNLYWFMGVMEGYGHLNELEALAAMVLFIVMFCPFWGAFGLVESWTARRSLPMALVLVPFLWVALELARTYLITGFPWDLLGYAVAPRGLEQLASWTGVYGLSFAAALMNALLAWLALAPRSWPARGTFAGFVVVLLAVNAALSPPRDSKAHHLAVLVQPDAPLNDAGGDEWAPWKNPVPLEQLVRLSLETEQDHRGDIIGSPLIVWSECSAPFFFDQDLIFRGAAEAMAEQAKAMVVVNTITFAGPRQTQPQNTAILLNPSGNVILEYHKIHLVPMGEYVPSWLRFTRMSKVTSEVSDFVPGRSYEVAHGRDGGIGVFICYEDIFPQLVRRLVPSGPGVLVNISDDSWYGTSAARYQHLNIARFRAIENHRYLLRATNDGLTAIIDPYGRVVVRAPQFRQAALAGHFRYLSKRTFYTSHGDVFAWSATGFAIAICLAAAYVRRLNPDERAKAVADQKA